MKLKIFLIELANRNLSKKGYDFLVSYLLELNKKYRFYRFNSELGNFRNESDSTNFLNSVNGFLISVYKSKLMTFLKRINDSYLNYLFEGLILKHFQNKSIPINIGVERDEEEINIEKQIIEVLNSLDNSEIPLIIEYFFDDAHASYDSLSRKFGLSSEVIDDYICSFRSKLISLNNNTNPEEGVKYVKLIHEQLLKRKLSN